MWRLVVAVVGALWLAGGVANAASPPLDLQHSYICTPSGRMTPLRAGDTYSASSFPLAVRVTPPDGSWLGAQWKSGTEYFRGGGPPNFGWIHLGHGMPGGNPRGLVTVMTACGPTPSVAATVAVLRTRGHGVSYGHTSPVTIAGFAGTQFDGQIVGAPNVDHIGHYFVPFSPRSHAAKSYPDEYGVYGDVFHVDVLNVRGKTVVYVENMALPDGRFPAFLESANRILATLRFPKGDSR